MARTTRRYQCAERASGCSEQAFYDFDTQREAREYDQRYGRNPWRCTRHSEPDEVLGSINPKRTVVMTAARSTQYPDLTGLFWTPEGGDSGSGFTFGPGFKAFANDFPEGTRLVITAAIEPALTQAPADASEGASGAVVGDGEGL